MSPSVFQCALFSNRTLNEKAVSTKIRWSSFTLHRKIFVSLKLSIRFGVSEVQETCKTKIMADLEYNCHSSTCGVFLPHPSPPAAQTLHAFVSPVKCPTTLDCTVITPRRKDYDFYCRHILHVVFFYKTTLDIMT